jgi:hypothetical protein
LSGWPSETDSEVNRNSRAMQRSSKNKNPQWFGVAASGDLQSGDALAVFFGRLGSLAALYPRPASCRINSADSQL